MYRRLFMVLGSIAILSACSRSPSQSDIEQAYRQEVDQVNQMTARLGAGTLAIKVNEVKKLDCQHHQQQQHYRCQVEIDTTLPFVGQRRENTEITLTSTEQGWKILRGLDSSS
jgi:outer membrane biogenesis lipoprotein LolB